MHCFNTKHLLQTYNLFWQYPVITEQEFYNQNKQNPNYCGIPWATFIDKRVDTNTILKLVIPYVKHKNYYTCCQHISFRKLVPLMKILGVKTVYTPHKVKGEDKINGVNIFPCPLYAVNIEDPKKNSLFKNTDLILCERKYLYSFMGGVQNNYISNIRHKIFSMKHPENTYIKNTGQWHFNNVVYSNKQNNKGELNIDQEHINKTNAYNKLLLDSRYSLCPSGSGPNSIRFWESLAAGSIPILLADTLELPYGHNWNKAILRIQEGSIDNINEVLSNITEEQENSMRKECISIYNSLKKNYVSSKQNIIHYCCGSYDYGDFGGVARFDHHISIAFPHRIFVQGPQHKNYLLSLVKELDDPIIITDNHLSCDIPNSYNIILVHHGSALTHAEREPDWSPYWKKLCCEGQKNMLKYRDPKRTKILSASTFCIDEFSRFFPEDYSKFVKDTLLHTSELKPISKRSFNDEPIIFGNFKGFLKGEHIFKKLEKTSYKVEKLNCYFDKKKHKNYENYNDEKQKFYLDRDIFLQLSLSEGNSYATLDAFVCGNVVIATDVGLTYNDVPEDCYVKLDHKKINDLEYLKKKIEYGWQHRDELSKNAIEYFNNLCSFKGWKKNITNIVNNY